MTVTNRLNMDVCVPLLVFSAMAGKDFDLARWWELLPAVLLVPSNLRLLLSRFLRRSVPQLKVLAHGEVPESKIIKVTSIIGGKA